MHRQEVLLLYSPPILYNHYLPRLLQPLFTQTATTKFCPAICIYPLTVDEDIKAKCKSYLKILQHIVWMS